MGPPNAVSTKSLDLYPSYNAYCIKKHVDPIPEAAAAFDRQAFLLHVDNMDPEELRIMFDFLSKCSNVEYAHVDVGKVPTKRALRQKLIRIGLEEPYAMLQPGYSKIVRSMSLMLSKSTQLISLHLLCIQITPDLASDLAKGLASCTTIQSIDLEGTQLGDTGLDLLEEALATRPNLCHLGMAGCNLTDKSARPVARILRTQAAHRDEIYWSITLRGQTAPVRGEGCFLLNLATNTLGDDSTEIFCHALYNDNWVYGINLNENKIGARGVLNFAEILQTNTTLNVLLLQDNSNTDNRVSTFVNKLLEDRQNATNASLNHPMGHLVLKGVLASWGCLRKSSLDHKLASIFQKVSRKVDPSRPSKKKLHQSTKTTMTQRPKSAKTKSTVKESSVVRSIQPKKKLQAKPKNVSRKELKEEVTSSALDMLVQDQMFRSNQETTPIPSKRLDHQMLVKLMERITVLETAQAKAQEHIDRVEAENLALKQRKSEAVTQPSASAECEIIQELECAIVKLTEQVQVLEKKRKPTKRSVVELSDDMIEDLSKQIKASFHLSGI